MNRANAATLAGLAVIVIILLLTPIGRPIRQKFKKIRSAPDVSILGGVTLAGSPSTTTPVTPGTVVSVAKVTPNGDKYTKRIKIIKDTTGSTADPNDPDWRTLAVSEIWVYYVDDQNINNMLKPSDYSSITLSSSSDGHPASSVTDNNKNTFASTASNDSMATLTITFKNEIPVRSIRVANRQDCCQARLAGAKILMEDITGETIWSSVLTGSNFDTIFADSNYSNSRDTKVWTPNRLLSSYSESARLPAA